MYPDSIENLQRKSNEYQSPILTSDKQLIQECKANHVFRQADTRENHINKLMRLSELSELKSSNILRDWVDPHITEYKQGRQPCNVCDLCDEKKRDLQVDHVKCLEFIVLFEKFSKMNKPPMMYVDGEIVLNEELWKAYKTKWIAYHNKHCYLQLLCKKCHKEKTKAFNESRK